MHCAVQPIVSTMQLRALRPLPAPLLPAAIMQLPHTEPLPLAMLPHASSRPTSSSHYTAPATLSSRAASSALSSLTSVTSSAALLGSASAAVAGAA